MEDTVTQRSIRNLAVILHDGGYDRVHHGLSLAVAALALGREVRLLFTYWALTYLKREGHPSLKGSSAERTGVTSLLHEIEKGHVEDVEGLLERIKALGGRIYACTNSMGILNISRDELRAEAERPVGLTTFLRECAEDQILFI
ncbi:MAG: hypothetical protein ACUVS3_11955 [Thermodesulfobacteriota bacterium]